MQPHWHSEDLEALRRIDAYPAMAELALRMLARMTPPVVQVCGPISTGGKGSLEANLAELARAIAYLADRGYAVFDQLPFEEPMQRVKYLRGRAGYPTDLLDEFYLPIFASGYVKELHFLPGWRSSHGATWEHAEAKRLGLGIVYFPEKWGGK